MRRKIAKAMKLQQLLFAVLKISLLIGCSRQAEPELPYAKGLQGVLDRARQSDGSWQFVRAIWHELP